MPEPSSRERAELGYHRSASKHFGVFTGQPENRVMRARLRREFAFAALERDVDALAGEDIHVWQFSTTGCSAHGEKASVGRASGAGTLAGKCFHKVLEVLWTARGADLDVSIELELQQYASEILIYRVGSELRITGAGQREHPGTFRSFHALGWEGSTWRL